MVTSYAYSFLFGYLFRLHLIFVVWKFSVAYASSRIGSSRRSLELFSALYWFSIGFSSSSTAQVMRSLSFVVQLDLVMTLVLSSRACCSASQALLLRLSSCVRKDPECQWRMARFMLGNLVSMLGGSPIFCRFGSFLRLLPSTFAVRVSISSRPQCFRILNIISAVSRRITSFTTIHFVVSASALRLIWFLSPSHFKLLVSCNAYYPTIFLSLFFLAP